MENTDERSLEQGLAIGHRPQSLAPQDEALFRAFQSNLLSLISHELQTPLTGILNSLGVLEEKITAKTFHEGVSTPGSASADTLGGTPGELSTYELIQMARKNSQRLHHSLSSLLNLAALESGTFHVKLREVDLLRLAKSRFEAVQSFLRDYSVKTEWKEDLGEDLESSPILADPQRLGQAIDLCFQILIPRTESGQSIQIRISSSMIEFQSQITSAAQQVWQSSWSQSLVGVEGGVSSPYSAFSGVLQSEEAFLSRVEEGLGSEFLLIHEVLRLHRGQFTTTLKENTAQMRIELPQLSSEEAIKLALASRVYPLATELGSVSLVLMQLPKNSHDMSSLQKMVSDCMFLSTDAVYPVLGRNQLALVLNDCKNKGVSVLMKKIEQAVGERLAFGAAHCPCDGMDAEILFDVAQKRLASFY